MDDRAPVENKDPRTRDEQLFDSILLALNSDIKNWCPKSFLGSIKTLEKVLKNNPEAGTESPCKGCRWHLKCADNFLNCAVIVFNSKEAFQYSNDEIAEMMGISSDTVRGILNSGSRKFIRKVNKKDGEKLRKLLEQIGYKLPPPE